MWRGEFLKHCQGIDGSAAPSPDSQWRNHKQELPSVKLQRLTGEGVKIQVIQ